MNDDKRSRTLVKNGGGGGEMRKVKKKKHTLAKKRRWKLGKLGRKRENVRQFLSYFNISFSRSLEHLYI